ncbi:hypothetical protein ACSBR2_015611 [Camellia fascicularis]
MIHGPCGVLNKKILVCVKVNAKSIILALFHPKQCKAKTVIQFYKRSEESFTVNVQNAVLDNRWVVPDNPYITAILMLRYA